MSRFCDYFKSSKSKTDESNVIVPVAHKADEESYRSYKLVEHEGSFTAAKVRFFARDSGHTVTISFEDGQEERSKLRLAVDGKPVHAVETADRPEGTECVRVIGKLADFTWDLNEIQPKFRFQLLKLKYGEPVIEYYMVLLE